MINRTPPIITTAINPHIENRFATCGGNPHALEMPTTKLVITDTARSSTRVLWTTGNISRTGRDRTTPGDCNVFVRSPWLNPPVLIGDTTMSPSCGIMGGLEILNIHGSTGSVKIGDTQKSNTSVDENLAEGEDSTTIFSKIIGQELSHGSSADIYLRCWMDFISSTVVTEAPYFVDLGLPAVNTSDEFNTSGTPATRFRRTMYGPHWSVPDHVFGEVKVVGMSGTSSELNYSYKNGFEIWRKNQDFGRQNISMSRPPLNSNPIVTNTTNVKTSPIDSIHIRTKTPDPTLCTQPME